MYFKQPAISFKLNNTEKAKLKKRLKIGIYQQLYQNGYLTSQQLHLLLEMQEVNYQHATKA